MAVTAALVKELREKSGAGMLDCKKALEETNGNIDEAVDWLRKKGLASAAKKAGRVAAEGLIGIAVEGNKGSLVEVNAETDFVAKNDQFIDFVKKVSQLSLAYDDIEALKAASFEGSNVQDYLTNLIATIGENMSLRRTASLSEPAGGVAAYVHNAVGEGLGKIGVLVGIKGDASKVEDFGRKVAMHIAASSPLALDQASLDPAAVEHERQVQMDIARNSGKPENIIEKMIEGRIRKYYEEVCLLEQAFALNPDIKVGQAAKDEGVEITGFVRYVLGEGIEKKEENFAEEVAKAIQ
ncbi:MAG: translation elongation factor Ts [Alphaproteobacteria bacterium]